MKRLIENSLISASLYLLSTSAFSSPMATMLGQSIYFLELLVIGLIAFALIVVTASISKSRKRMSQAVTDIREEIGQEQAILSMTMKTIKEKEQQITYMAHLLQVHLENKPEQSSDAAEDNKKKVVKDEVCVEVIDDTHEQTVEINSENTSEGVDPRFVSADGSVKQAHFGQDQYLAEVKAYHQQSAHRMKEYVQGVNHCLLTTVNDIQYEITAIKAERNRLKDFIETMQADREGNMAQSHMNSRDRGLVKSLTEVEQGLQGLQNHYEKVESQFSKVLSKSGKFSSYDALDEKVELSAVSAV